MCTCSKPYTHVHVYSRTSLIWTLAFVTIVVILYKTTPELRTPLQSGQLHGSQWCPQYRGYTVHTSIIVYHVHTHDMYIHIHVY